MSAFFFKLEKLVVNSQLCVPAPSGDWKFYQEDLPCNGSPFGISGLESVPFIDNGYINEQVCIW